MTRARTDTSKPDRALELHEKGLPYYIIAERLGAHTRNIGAMIDKAKKRREKQEAE